MNTQPTKEEFLSLILDNKGIIIKICNSYCRNKNHREDLAQEIIYHLWKSGNRFNASHTFTTWMYRIALNVAISFYRKEKTATNIISLMDGPIDFADTPVNGDETAENIRLLQDFISQLNELDRALMILFLEEKSYQEIADILGISETNVGTRISRIRKKLKQQFSPINE